MPPGPVFHLCAVRQVHAVCCLHNQVILHIPHLILVNNLWGRHFTQLQTHSSLFSSEKHVSTGGSGPKRAALTGSQTEVWTPQRLIELSDISGCDFLTVFRSRFKPKEQRHPSPSTVRRTGLETVSDVIVPTLFRDLRKELLILYNSIPCTQNITLYKWLVMTGAQHKTGIHQQLTQESELNRQITNNQRPRFVQMEKPWSFTFMTLSKSALH